MLKNKTSKAKRIFVFFGPPGSGKGTQAEFLAEKTGLKIVSPGKLLRQEIKAESRLGKKVAFAVEHGRLAGDRLVDEIVDKRLKKRDVAKGFILDGYPRSRYQAKHVGRKLHGLISGKDFLFIILVDVKDSEVKKRFFGRRVCACGASYHLKYNPPKKRGICDLCGRKLFMRKDDRPETIKERLKIYHHFLKGILNYWHENGKLIRIDGERHINEVKKEIFKELKKRKAL